MAKADGLRHRGGTTSLICPACSNWSLEDDGVVSLRIQSCVWGSSAPGGTGANVN